MSQNKIKVSFLFKNHSNPKFICALKKSKNNNNKSSIELG